jgi:prepilin signal peptidase PulO-like enzyme (type II secretory pathway)
VPVRYVAGVDTLLVAGATLAGLVIGGALDPVGQRLADQSRADDERRRADQEASAAAADGHLPMTVSEAGDPTSDTTGEPVATPEALRELLPAGRSPRRSAIAAVVTGVLFGAAAWHFGPDVIVAPFCVFFAMLVVVSTTDLSHNLVPRRAVYLALALIVPLLVLTSGVDHRWHSLAGSAAAGAVAFGLFFGVWWFVPRGMGFGDVRLAGVIGVTVGYLSLLHAYVAFLAGFVTGMLFGLAALAVTSSGRKTRIPFAPSLAVGAVFGVLWGGQVAHNLFHAGS